MRIPSNINDKDVIRVQFTINGSFGDTIELSGAELKNLATLVTDVPKVPKLEPVLKAGDAAAEKRADQPKTTVETRSPDSEIKAPETVSETPVDTPAKETPPAPK